MCLLSSGKPQMLGPPLPRINATSKAVVSLIEQSILLLFFFFLLKHLSGLTNAGKETSDLYRS